WCLVAAALDAEILARSRVGERVIMGGEYFLGTFSTRLRPEELLTEIRLPLLDEFWHAGFYEFSRRAGDFAIAATLAALRIESGKVIDARLGVGGEVSAESKTGHGESPTLKRRSSASLRVNGRLHKQPRSSRAWWTR
ncbi:MAG: FAD binding domain-containing protein, partial [Betaproteobacteria bacterium]|nr:FAD binding domain-containing protein [Betaproteobacteria bacterium]